MTPTTAHDDVLDQLWEASLRDPAADVTTDDAALDDGPEPEAEPAVGLWATISVIGKHWKLVVGVLVVTLLACGAAFKFVPASYEANGQMILLSPENNPANLPKNNAPATTVPASPGAASAAAAAASATTLPAATNPYLDFGSLNVVAEVLTTVMSGDKAGTTITDQHKGSTFEVANAPGDAPILHLTASGKTPEEASATYQAVEQEAQSQLLQMQQAQGSSTDLAIRIVPLNEPTAAILNSGSRIRVLIALVILGLGFAVLAAFAAEGLAQSRRNKGPGSPTTPNAPVTGPPATSKATPASTTATSGSGTDSRTARSRRKAPADDTIDVRDDAPRRANGSRGRTSGRDKASWTDDGPTTTSSSGRVTSLFDRDSAAGLPSS